VGQSSGSASSSVAVQRTSAVALSCRLLALVGCTCFSLHRRVRRQPPISQGHTGAIGPCPCQCPALVSVEQLSSYHGESILLLSHVSNIEHSQAREHLHLERAHSRKTFLCI